MSITAPTLPNFLFFFQYDVLDIHHSDWLILNRQSEIHVISDVQWNIIKLLYIYCKVTLRNPLKVNTALSKYTFLSTLLMILHGFEKLHIIFTFVFQGNTIDDKFLYWVVNYKLHLLLYLKTFRNTNKSLWLK